MIEVDWANTEKTLLLWQFSYRWLCVDFTNACQQTAKMVKSRRHPISIIVDLSASRVKPANIIHIGLSGMRMITNDIEHVIVVSPSKLWSNVYQYIACVYPQDTVPVQFVNTLDEARQVLGQPFFVKRCGGQVTHISYSSRHTLFSSSTCAI